jgi:hypothetical protein
MKSREMKSREMKRKEMKRRLLNSVDIVHTVLC